MPLLPVAGQLDEPTYQGNNRREVGFDRNFKGCGHSHLPSPGCRMLQLLGRKPLPGCRLSNCVQHSIFGESLDTATNKFYRETLVKMAQGAIS